MPFSHGCLPTALASLIATISGHGVFLSPFEAQQPQIHVLDLLSEFSHPAWALFTELVCDWLAGMVLCFLIERRTLNYFSNHLLST